MGANASRAEIERESDMGEGARPTVRDAVIDLLRRFGMTSIFANPGSTELPLFRYFPADFRYVLGLQEAVVVGVEVRLARSGPTTMTTSAVPIELTGAAVV